MLDVVCTSSAAALRGGSPSGEKRGTQVGADRLASGWLRVPRSWLCLAERGATRGMTWFGVFVTLNLMASRWPHRITLSDQSLILKPGQLLSGRQGLAHVLGVDEAEFDAYLSQMELLGLLRVEQLDGYSLYTLTRYAEEQQITDHKQCTSGNANQGRNGEA